MRDLTELISAYFDDSLREGELEHLRALLATDPEWLRQFAREAAIHSRLRDVLVQHDMRKLAFEDAFSESIDPTHIASLLDEEELASAQRARQEADRLRREAEAAARHEAMLDRSLMHIDEPRIPRALVYASVAAAATLLVMVGRFIAPKPSHDPVGVAASRPRAAAEAPVLAEIVRTFDATVRRDQRTLEAGARLQAGPLAFERGVVELQFASGVRLIAEGQVQLELMTAERARLIRGRVVVHVPKPVLGFTLHSDAATFVDLGTEFGVDVGDSGTARMHVLDGEVAFVPVRGSASSRTLQRGSAYEVNMDGDVRDIPFDGSFVRRVPASAYELAVLKSRPLACWRLDSAEPFATIASDGRISLPSLVNAGIAASENRARGQERNGPQKAAFFDGDHDGIDVPPEAALGAVTNCTYEAWALPETTKTGPKRIFSTFDRPRSGMAIGLVDGTWYKLPDDRLKLHLTVYGFYDCMSTTPIAVGQWVHVAATVDAGGVPKLYVNGELSDSRIRNIVAVDVVNANELAPEAAWTAGEPTPIGAATTGQARIGRNPVGSDGAISPEQWKGQIGNVAVYDRVLSAEEVHEHFLATRDTLTDHGGQTARTGTKP